MSDTIPTPRSDAEADRIAKGGDTPYMYGFSCRLEAELSIAEEALNHIVESYANRELISAGCASEAILKLKAMRKKTK